MDREVLCESLMLWLETFNLDVAHATPEELSDGIAMSKVLHQIAPDYFNESWLSKIKIEDITWRIKVSNLKKILKGILEYNLEVLGIQIHDFQMPDVNAIGEHSDHGELGRLLQLILGCAVNCTEKQEYIQRIMAMEESVQHAVMTAIQELMTKEITTDVDSEVGEQLRKTVEELNSAIEAKEQLMQRCHDLDLQVTGLLEEKQNLCLENEKLSERLNQSENLDDPSTPAGKRFQQLSHQLDQLQEENYKLESAKDDYRIKVDVLQKEVNEAKDKNSELASLAEENRVLKDELDVLRHAAEQVAKYETQIESYKKKMEDLSDLRGQVKLLEDKNTKYMQENLEIQEEVRKSSAIKQQLEVYKRQVHEHQSKLTEETKRADKSEFESKRLQEKLATLQREKERIVTERDSLREVNEELKCTQLQHVKGSASEELSETTGMEMLSLPPEIREKMLRLEHENKMLKLKSGGDSDEQTQVIQTMLDDANTRKNELETDLRIANQKNMELEAQIEDLQEMAKTTVSNTEMIELRKKLDEQVQQTQGKDKALEKEREGVADLQSQITRLSEELEKLRDEIEKKEEEKRVMGEKYKRYFDKARAVITSQEQKLKSTGNHYPDIQALKQQLQEKDRYIEHLQKEQEKNKNTFEQEEKMMVSAWYNLGIQLHRQAAIDRLENTQCQAFLNRQRQVHLRGQQRIPNSHNNPASDLDPGVSANQNMSSGDGCFTSLFDCLLTRIHKELQSQSDLDPADAGLSPSAIQVHLLAGLMGRSQEEIPEDESFCMDNQDVSSTSRDGLLSSDHKETNATSCLTCTKGDTPKTPEYQIRYKKGPAVHQRLYCPRIVPETPEVEKIVYSRSNMDDSNVPLLDGSYRDDHEEENNPVILYPDGCAYNLDFSTDDINQHTPSEEKGSNSEGNPKLEDINIGDIDDFCILNDNKGMLQPDEALNKETLLTAIGGNARTPFDSFFKKLDEYDTADEDVSNTESVNTTKDADESFKSNSGNSVLKNLLDTPMRNTTGVEVPVHEQSPFVKKIPTDRVTKRRSRRKRRHKALEDEAEKENDSGNSAVDTKYRAVEGNTVDP